MDRLDRDQTGGRPSGSIDWIAVRHQHAPVRWVGLVVQGGASCTSNFPLLQTKADGLLISNICRSGLSSCAFRLHAVVMFSRAISSVASA